MFIIRKNTCYVELDIYLNIRQIRKILKMKFKFGLKCVLTKILDKNIIKLISFKLIISITSANKGIKFYEKLPNNYSKLKTKIF